MTRSGPPPSPLLALAVVLYIVTLPLAQLVVLPVSGAVATLSDLALAGLVAVGLVVVLAEMTSPGSPAEAPAAPLPPDVVRGLVLLGLFGVWTGLSGNWGYHPVYAAMKGGGIVALAAGAWCFAAARLDAGKVADAWIVGAVIALVAAALLALVPSVRWRVLYQAGLVEGLPFPRVRGPFTHPNVLGEFLALTGVLLWARWPSAIRRGRGLARGAAILIGGALLLTAASGWLVAGVALLLLGASPRWGGGRIVRRVVGASGAVLAGATFAGLLGPVRVSLGGMRITTGGIRPEIWSDAAAAVTSSRLLGVGASPYLAETADPMAAADAGTALWDAHSVYLSVVAQTGVVGGVLFFGGVALLLRGAWLGLGRAAVAAADIGDAADTVEAEELLRLRFALLAAAAGLLVHWLFIAGEDFRHLWALLGLLAAAGAMGATDAAETGPAGDRGRTGAEGG